MGSTTYAVVAVANGSKMTFDGGDWAAATPVCTTLSAEQRDAGVAEAVAGGFPHQVIATGEGATRLEQLKLRHVSGERLVKTQL